MQYPNEIISAKKIPGLKLSKIKVKPQELKVASKIIKTMSRAFTPKRYKDEHRKRVLTLIKKKAQGQTIKIKTIKSPRATQVEELLKQLEESVNLAQ